MLDHGFRIALTQELPLLILIVVYRVHQQRAESEKELRATVCALRVLSTDRETIGP